MTGLILNGETLKTEINNPRYNLRGLEDDTTIYLYRKRLDEKLKKAIFDNTWHLYQYILNKSNESANEALGEVNITYK